MTKENEDTKTETPLNKSNVEGWVMCEGSCEEHVGEVKKVHVVLEKPYHDWGFFNYCAAAIEEDINRGFKVTNT